MTQPDPSAESTETETPAEPEQESKPTPFDPSSLPPEARDWIKQQVEGEKFKARDGARKAAAEEAKKSAYAEIAQKLGLTSEDEEVGQDELQARLESAQSEAFKGQVENQLIRITSRLGLDGDAMWDSDRFKDALADAFDEVPEDDPKHIARLNPRSAAFEAEVERAMNAALEKVPRLKGTTSTGPRPDPSQGARGAGPSLDSRIAEAQKAGRWREVISLQNQKLANT